MCEAPDYVTPVEGWRLWNVAAGIDSLHLRSIVFDVAWPRGRPLVAACFERRRRPLTPWRRDDPRHAVPAALCRCGIYAVSDPYQLAPYLDGRSRLGRGLHRAIGRVALWGTVVEADRGWRASHAYPRRLYIPLLGAGIGPSPRAIAAELEDYGVPVEIVPAADTPDVLSWLSRAEAA